jgi:gliding motility-associated-like protein
VKTYTTQSKSPLKSPLPNIFTPNGDGLNECYTPAEVTSSTQCYDIYIYNRWGQLVYDKAEDGDCWNGSHRNKGRNVTDGVYFFVLYLDGKKKEGGTITVSR